MKTKADKMLEAAKACKKVSESDTMVCDDCGYEWDGEDEETECPECGSTNIAEKPDEEEDPAAAGEPEDAEAEGKKKKGKK